MALLSGQPVSEHFLSVEDAYSNFATLNNHSRMRLLRAALIISLLAVGMATIAPAAEELRMSRLSFVVLPFANSSGDLSQDYIAANVTIDLTDALSRIKGSSVIAYASAVASRSLPSDPIATARRLGVRFSLHGSALRREDRIEVAARLVDAETGEEVWHATVEREFVQLPAVASETAANIGRTLNADVAAIQPRAVFEDAEAFDALLRGKAMLEMPPTAERLAEARVLLGRALRVNPTTVDAMVGLASIHLAAALAPKSPSPISELSEGERLAKQAVAINPDDSRALDVLGAFRRAAGRRDQALAAYEAALAANPSDANACGQIARVKLDLGDAADSVPLLERALALSPLDPQRPLWFTFAGMALLYRREPGQARAWLEKALEVNPRFVTALVFLAAAEELDGDEAGARRSLATARQMKPEISIARIEQQLAPEGPDARVNWAIIMEGLRRAGLPQ